MSNHIEIISRFENMPTEFEYRITRTANLDSLLSAIREQTYHSSKAGDALQVKQVALGAGFNRENQLTLIASGERGIRPEQLDALFRFAEECDCNFIREYFKTLIKGEEK